MKVVGLGDAHLGRSYLNRTTADGFNQREVDFERSFEAAIDLALAQEPDVMVVLGDLFDHPRPTYRSFRIAQRAFGAIRDRGLPCVVISGNHDTPRLPGTGSPYSALADTFAGIRFVHRLQYERIDLGDLVVHAVPQMLTVEATRDALAEAYAGRSLDHTNLLISHPRVPQVEPRYADINEIEVDAGELKADLVLLGHYHFHVKVAEGIWYAGATDTFNFADDPERPKGIVVLDTDSGVCRHLEVPGRRPLTTLRTVEAAGMSPSELNEAILERARSVEPGAVARLFIDQVEAEAYRLLDMEAVREAAAPALDLKLCPTFADAAGYEDLPDVESMPARWDRYVERQDLSGFDRDAIRSAGHAYLARAVEEASE